jgi:tetratricopeptide (TPR) repeat protein
LAGLFHFCPMRLFFAILLLTTAASCTPDSPKDSENPEPAQAGMTLLDSINEQLLEKPNNIDLFLERAELFMLMDSLDMAMKDINRALRIDSTSAQAHHDRGQIHYFKKDIDLALEEFEICIEYDADHCPCLLKKAEIQMLLRQYDEALVLINSALRVDEFQPEAYYMKGLLYKESGDTNLAVSSYVTATELDPTFYDAYIQVGLLYASAHSDLAIEYYNSALDIAPNSVEALYAKGIYLQDHAKDNPGRLREALEVYDELQMVDTTFAAAPYNQGFIYLEYFAEYDSAATKFGAAIRQYPMYFQAFYNRGLCFESMDELQRALNDYTKALHMKPDYTPAAIAKSRVLESM